MKHYDGSLVKTVLDLFPEIGLVETKFAVVPRMYTKKSEGGREREKKEERKITNTCSGGFLSIKKNRRSILEQFARDSGLDPLIPPNWYSVSYDAVCGYKVL